MFANKGLADCIRADKRGLVVTHRSLKIQSFIILEVYTWSAPIGLVIVRLDYLEVDRRNAFECLDN